MKKVLITDSVHSLLMEGFQKAGFHCDYRPKISLVQVLPIIPEYTGLIINSKILVDQHLLDRARLLRFVGRLGSGMEIVDQAFAEKRGVDVYSSPEGNCNAVAEQALGMLLALANNLLRADRQVRNKKWKREENRGFELRGKTLGIIGFGHTGSRFAQKLSGMGIKVLAYDKYKKDFAGLLTYVEECSLKKLLSESQIISFHLPLSEETRQLADKSFIDSCQSGVILINTSRGQIVNTNDLVQALSIGQVGGACLDVFENEKVESFTKAEHQLYDQLYAFDNVVLSPHIAGWTFESKEGLARILLEKILADHSS